MSTKPFEPKIISVLREGYNTKTFLKDLIAGITVGIVALPLSIAIAIASGVKPEQGLYTAVIAGFIISLLSGSRVQIGGPTGAFIVIVFAIVKKYGYDGLALATLMSGVFLIILGFARMGDVIKFIPYPVTIGFTSGIAVIIFTSQVKDFLGLNLSHTPDAFLDKWGTYITHVASVNPEALMIGFLTILIIIFTPRITERIPGTLIAIVVSTILVHWLKLPVETIATRFGSVPNSLPHPSLPPISVERLIQLSSPALTITLLAGIESLLSAVVADGMTGRRHRSNAELIAQGVANIVSPIFAGIPATGAIARTATNIRNGGTTPFAGMFHAFTILIILLCFGQWAALIPMPALAGILVYVAYTMGEWHMFIKLLRSPKSDILVLLITFLLTVLIDLTVAIEVGVVLAAFLFMRRMIEVTQINYISDAINSDDDADTDSLSKINIPAGVDVFEINGPFFFGAADKFKDTLKSLKKNSHVLIFRMRNVPVMDATALRALEEVDYKSRRDGSVLILCEVQEQPLRILKESELGEKLTEQNIKKTFDEALETAQTIIATRTPKH